MEPRLNSPGRYSSRTARLSARGFTLVELMTVVVIVSVLALMGIVGLRQHIFASRTAEALAMIQSIRIAEERWKAENMVYLNVSSSSTSWYPADPRGDATRIKRNFFLAPGGHTDDAAWKALKPTVPGPVEFGYMVNSGPPGQVMTPPAISVPNWAGWTPSGEYWYVIQAVADYDHDGVPAYFLASSLKADIYRQDEGE